MLLFAHEFGYMAVELIAIAGKLMFYINFSKPGAVKGTGSLTIYHNHHMHLCSYIYNSL